MGVDDFRDAFKYYTIVNVHKEWTHSFVEKRQALNKKNYRFNFTITEDMVSNAVHTKSNEDPAEKTSSEDKENSSVSNDYKTSNSSVFPSLT
jgi:hypothetical protein